MKQQNSSSRRRRRRRSRSSHRTKKGAKSGSRGQKHAQKMQRMPPTGANSKTDYKFSDSAHADYK